MGNRCFRCAGCRSLPALALAFLLSLVAFGVAGAETWQVFQPPEKEYRVSMPGIPKLMSDSSGTGTEVRMYGLESSHYAYVVGVVDMPAPLVGEQRQMVLNEVRRSLLSEFRAKQKSVKPIMFGAAAGIEFEGRSSGENLKARLYVRGNKLYQIYVVIQSGHEMVSAAGAKRFIDSFEILPGNELR